MSDCKCGPWFMPKALRCALSKHFNSACAEHDRVYASGFSRRQADRAFLKACLKTAGGVPSKAQAAIIYYWAVRAFGWLSKKPRWIK